MSVTSKPAQWGPNQKQDDYHTLPGVFARQLLNEYGLSRRIGIAAWYVDTLSEKVEKVHIIQLHGADLHYTTADYAELANERRVPTMYLFPVRKHCKPKLKLIRDELGECNQWVGPWRHGVYAPFA